MEYKKRTKSKVVTGISSLLQSSPKTQMLSQAFFFSIVNKALLSIFENDYNGLVDDFKLCEVFVQHSILDVKITIQSADFSFLTWFKTETLSIEENLTQILLNKKVLKPEESIHITIKRR